MDEIGLKNISQVSAVPWFYPVLSLPTLNRRVSADALSLKVKIIIIDIMKLKKLSPLRKFILALGLTFFIGDYAFFMRNLKENEHFASEIDSKLESRNLCADDFHRLDCVRAEIEKNLLNDSWLTLGAEGLMKEVSKKSLEARPERRDEILAEYFNSVALLQEHWLKENPPHFTLRPSSMVIRYINTGLIHQFLVNFSDTLKTLQQSRSVAGEGSSLKELDFRFNALIFSSVNWLAVVQKTPYLFFPYYEVLSPKEVVHFQGLQQRQIAATPEFDSLSPEKKKSVEEDYKSAFEFYKKRNYDDCLLALSRVFAEVPNGYKDSREIQAFAKEGLRKLKAQETAPKNL